MNLQKFLKKKTLCLAIISALFLNIAFLNSPKQAQADIISDAANSIIPGGGDILGGIGGFLGIGGNSNQADCSGGDCGDNVYVTNKGLKSDTSSIASKQTSQDLWTRTIQPLLEQVAQQSAIQLINNITESTINWIKGGFNGNPAFISDLPNFLHETANQTVGDMIFNDPNLNFLCAPFRTQVRVALKVTYEQSSFYNKISCTFSGVLNNIQNAGWSGWLQLSLYPQNTLLGAYLEAQSELQSRISSKQSAAVAELNFGRGALSYQQCSKVYYDKNGHDIKHESLSNVGSQYYVDGAKTLSRDGSYYQIVCNDKTPGAVITDTLGFTVTSDQRQNELRATLSNGINSVIGALLNELTKKGIGLIQNVLGDTNTTQQDVINKQFNFSINETQASYNNQINNPNNTPNANVGSYSSILGPNYINSLNQYNPQNTNANDFDSAKTKALNLINALIAQEQTYQSLVNQSIQIDTGSLNIFTVARTCNININTSTSTLRATLIYANVIENINGISDSSRNLSDIVWNLPYLANLISISNTNINILNGAENAVNNATSSDALTAAMVPVFPVTKFDNPKTVATSTRFGTNGPNSFGSTDSVNGLESFFTTAKGYYSTPQCPIDLSSVF